MYWSQKIMECYTTLCSKLTTKTMAQLHFISQLKTNNHLWEVHQFNVKVNLTFKVSFLLNIT